MIIKSFFSKDKWESILQQLHSAPKSLLYTNIMFKSNLKQHHQELLNGLFSKKDAFYYETNKQIFVHAGIYEIDEELWKDATEEREFTWKFPAEIGSFYKDIIAGHVSTVEVSGDNNFLGKVYWDNESHFFIDGETNLSGVIPLLKYDIQTTIYSSFEKNHDNQWIEYKIK